MKGLIGVAALFAGLALPVAGATAKQNYQTQLEVDLSFEIGFDRALMTGYIESEKRKCLSGRKVTGLIGEKGNLEKEDTTKTSTNGGFGLVTSDDGPVYRVKVAPKRIGNDLCQGALYSAS